MSWENQHTFISTAMCQSKCDFSSPPCWGTKLTSLYFLVQACEHQPPFNSANSLKLCQPVKSFINTVIISFKTVCHITSTVRGFSWSLSLSVWKLYVAYGKRHHIIGKRLPEEDWEIRLERFFFFFHQKVQCMLSEGKREIKISTYLLRLLERHRYLPTRLQTLMRVQHNLHK